VVPLNILILEDVPDDAELMVRALRQAGFEFVSRRIDSSAELAASLHEGVLPDLILADYSLPDLTALDALHLLQQQEIDLPLVVVTGSISEEIAAACIKEGASDYLLKDRLTRLGAAVTRALATAQLRADSARAILALRESEARFRRLAENARDMIYRFRVRPDPSFEYVSPAATLITGYSPESITPTLRWLGNCYSPPTDRPGLALFLATGSMATGFNSA
jgi:CheY-like chemotaxis protein